MTLQGTQRRFLIGHANAFTSGRVTDGYLEVIPLMDGLPRAGSGLPDHLDAAQALLEMYNADLLPTGPATTWRLLFLMQVLANAVDPKRAVPGPKLATSKAGPVGAP